MAPTLQQEIIHPPLMVTKRNLHIIPGLRIFVGAVICPCVLAPSAGGFYLSHKARRLFTVGTFGDTQCGSGPPVLRMDGARFNPRKKFFFREYRAASELPVRDSVFVDLIVERGPVVGMPCSVRNKAASSTFMPSVWTGSFLRRKSASLGRIAFTASLMMDCSCAGVVTITGSFIP